MILYKHERKDWYCTPSQVVINHSYTVCDGLITVLTTKLLEILFIMRIREKEVYIAF